MSAFRQLLLIAVLAIAAFGGYQAWQRYDAADGGGNAAAGKQQGRERPAILVEVQPVGRRTMSTTVEAVGTTIAAKSVEIVSLADGRIRELLFRSGQKVAQGDRLVELDRDMQEADATEAEAARVRIQAELERAKSLFGNKIVSAARVEELTAQLAAAEAQLKRSNRQLDDRTIRAPFAGTVGLNRVDIGARITESTVITTLDDLSHVEVEFTIPESLFGIARIGHTVEARTAAYPDRVFTGKVIEIDSRIDAASRAFHVRADLPNEDGALPAGMFMQVSMSLTGGETTVIPEEAVIAESGAAYVFVVEEDKASRRQIELGRRAFGIVEVVSGIDADALVVTRGISKLRDGMSVKIKLADAGTGSGG
ncbi:MAG: efflux RND transporter periplasmic adaptor subunit [Rhodobiaceae bacterium]|nr:efflux RND transporter periplasmic adaptor subunit [Rhodobiaceae bacterium]